MRVWLFGGRGPFGREVLERLVASDIDVVGYAVPHAAPPAMPSGTIPLTLRDPLADALEAAGARPLQLPPGRTQATLPEAVAGDAAVVACFPSRLPESWLSRFPRGTYNIHPSALPRYRGPAPVFWQMRDGAERFGVSVHRVTRELDAGPVVATDALEAAPGALEERVELRLAGAGARLAVDVLERLGRGAATPAAPQDESLATYQSWPTEDAFCVDPRWPVRRAFGFIAGTRRWQRPYRVRCEDTELTIRAVHEFEEGPSRPGRWAGVGARLRVEFEGGWIVAHGAPGAAR